jgi:S-adenosylmethionine-diacylgycerolhomoserine-N-methlytransferase
VLFSYTLSMIPGWEHALRTAAERLLPGGEVHIVDFGPCDRLPAPAKALLYAWLNQFHVMPRLSLSAECARLARSKGLRFDHKFSHRGYVQRVVLSKH